MIFCTACGRPRRGPARFCTACGAPFAAEVGTEAPGAESPADAPPPPVANNHPDMITAYPPPGGGLAAPEQPGAAAGQQPSASAAEHDVAEHDSFGDLFAPRSADSAGSPERFGATVADQGYGSAEPRDLLTSPPPGGRGKAVLVALVAIAVLAAGGGVAFWLTHRHQVAHTALSGQANPSGTGSRGVTESPSPPPSPTPTPAPTSSGNLVTAGPGVAQDAEASRVEAFLNSYFTAINNHSYLQYRALLDRKMQRDESAQAFHVGYHSTTDSAATLTTISDLGPGLISATVTFTSHQLPADSPSKTACTDWNITLNLRPHGSGYVLGPAPPGYHATYQPC